MYIFKKVCKILEKGTNSILKKISNIKINLELTQKRNSCTIKKKQNRMSRKMFNGPEKKKIKNPASKKMQRQYFFLLRKQFSTMQYKFLQFGKNLMHVEF